MAGRPVLALPVDQVSRRRVGHAFPPDIAIVGERDVGEDDVAPERRHAIGVGLLVGARRNAEVARLGIDRHQPPVLARLDPRDVVADGGDLPAGQRLGRHQHREVRFAASAGKRRRHMVLLAGRRRDAEDQHVLGEPALIAPHLGGDAQRKALLAEQRVAAITRPVAPDLVCLGIVNDVLGLVARPRDIELARHQRRADAVHARHEVAIVAEHLEHRAAHARHDAHVDRDVRRIGELDADVRDRRAERPHRERHHVHRAAAHAASEQRVVARLEQRAHLGGIDPVVGRAPRLPDAGCR